MAYRLTKVLAALFFTAAGCLHLMHPEPFLKIMPPVVPAPLTAVYVSGIAEVLGGVGLLIPTASRVAAWGLAVLLVAVFPSNVYMAICNISVTTFHVPAWALWARLPLQVLLIWWVLLYRR